MLSLLPVREKVAEGRMTLNCLAAGLRFLA